MGSDLVWETAGPQELWFLLEALLGELGASERMAEALEIAEQTSLPRGESFSRQGPAGGRITISANIDRSALVFMIARGVARGRDGRAALALLRKQVDLRPVPTDVGQGVMWDKE